jgi:hypothetical protein
MGDCCECVEQEGCATVLNKVRPHVHEEAPGVPDSGAHAKPSQSPFTSPLSQLASAPSIQSSETEVRMQRLISGWSLAHCSLMCSLSM